MGVTSFNGWTHPQWDDSTLANDIALIELPSPMSFNDYIKPSCLPTAGDTPVPRCVDDIPVMSNAECNAVYGIVGDGIVCIDTTGGRGTCNGDSGGPLDMMGDMKAAG